MEWMNGLHLGPFIQERPSQELKNRVGQTLWNFYQFQIHQLKTLHADAHPGNFIIRSDGSIAVIDFGCTKELPDDFYQSYFRLLDPDSFRVSENRDQLFLELGFIHVDDSEEERKFYTETITETIELLGRPFYQPTFDFSDKDYFKHIYQLGERLSRSEVLRHSRHARGSRHALYLNRTFFGLYNLLHQLQAKINTREYL
jgi:predicted unusual protein kinase regulating ubiquinone biosynthesis (AarF/ABC1/UbiB family)